MEPQPPKNSAADPAANAVENPGEFPLTPWTMVARAGKKHAQDMQQALDQLLKRYIPALHANLLLLTSLANFLVDEFRRRKSAGDGLGAGRL